MPDIDAYLVFDGNCAEAMRFYERTLGGKLEVLMTHGQSPMAEKLPPESADRILHARLALNGRWLMASDDEVGARYEGMKGFALSLIYPTAAEAERTFDALAAGGKVTSPMQNTFFAERFGTLTDRFGTPWMVSGGMGA